MNTTREMNLSEGGNSRIDARRRVLLCAPGLMALGPLTAVSLGQSTSAQVQTQSDSVRNDVNILNVALGPGYQAIATYQVGAESGLLQKPVLTAAVKFRGHYKTHASVLTGTVSKLDGTPVMEKKVAEYNFPASQLKTQASVPRFTVRLKKGIASAYLGVVPSFHTHDLVKAAANVLDDEVVRWAVLFSVLGKDLVPVVFIS